MKKTTLKLKLSRLAVATLTTSNLVHVQGGGHPIADSGGGGGRPPTTTTNPPSSGLQDCYPLPLNSNACLQ